MALRILMVGRKHESWVVDGIERYEKRLSKPFDLTWQPLPHSAKNDDAARVEESDAILSRLSGKNASDYVILLDERGRNIDSPTLATTLRAPLDRGQSVTLVIGGAYGVDPRVHARADFVWSLSKLVFPHQLVRLILAEQIYRAQEISAGRPYHHM